VTVLNGQPCEECEHPGDDHSLIPTGLTPLDGGVMLCPTPGCRCFSTWSYGAGTQDMIRLPDEAELAAMRAIVQA
jgi:hypothetical protein